MEHDELLALLRAYVHESTALLPSDDELIITALRLAHEHRDELVIQMLAQVARARQEQQKQRGPAD